MTGRKYAVAERERRFLVDGAPAGLDAGRLIEDTYLPSTRLRFRRVTHPDGRVERKLTQKQPDGAAVWCTNLYLDDAEWERMWRPGSELVKRRHLIGELPIALDVFEGPLAGLVLAEVDRGEGDDDPDLADRLQKAGLTVLREVTDESAYTGAVLAFDGLRTPNPQAGLRIRPFEERDWAAVEPIFREVMATGETYTGDPAMTDAAARDYWLSDQHAVVAEIDGVVVGSAHCGPNRPAQGSHVGTASFIVGAAARGHGVGRALGEYVVGWLRDAGFAGIQFNAVVSTNAAAVALWRSLGFEVVGTAPGAFVRPSGETADLLIMFKELP